MGMFSFQCAISGIEIAGPHCGAPAWMNEIVTITEDQTLRVGTYDGYGRLVTPDGYVEDFYEKTIGGDKSSMRIALADLYCGQTYEKLSPPQLGEFQGHFFAPGYFEYAQGIREEIKGT